LSKTKNSIELNKDTLIEIDEYLRNKYKTDTKIAKALGCSRRFYSKIKKYKSHPSSKYVLKISELTNIPLSRIILKIFPYSSYKYSWINIDSFPIQLNKTIAALVGHTISDGGISQTFFYSNSNPRLIKAVISLVEKLPVENCSSNFWEHKGTIVRFSSLVKDILICAGSPQGNKITQKVTIPEWIILGDLEIRKYFLRAMFDDEGTVSTQKRQISLGMNKNVSFKEEHVKFFRSLREMLLLLGIDSVSILDLGYGYGKNGITFKLNLQIYGRDNFDIFENKIGFISEHKKKNLKYLLKVKRLRYNRYRRTNQIIKELTNNNLTAKIIAKNIRLGHKGTLNKLSELEKEGVVIRNKVSNKDYRFLWSLNKDYYPF